MTELTRFVSALNKEKAELESALKAKSNEMIKMEQTAREKELKIADLKRQLTKASSSAGATRGKDWQAHAKEQSIKIVELKAELRATLEVFSVISS